MTLIPSTRSIESLFDTKLNETTNLLNVTILSTLSISSRDFAFGFLETLVLQHLKLASTSRYCHFLAFPRDF